MSLTSHKRIETVLMPIIRNTVCLFLFFFVGLSRRRKVSVLMYHSVDLNKAFENVDPVQFQRQVTYLRENYNLVSLDEIVGFIKRGEDLPSKAVAITFDDGYLNNFSKAYPYLRLHKIPATIFVATGYIGQRMLLNQIPLEMLDWSKIIEMNKNDIAIGAHTVNHPHLREMNLDMARNEILSSKEEIEKHTGKKLKYFSSPYGEANDKIVDMVKSLGFECMFAGAPCAKQIQKASKSYVLGRTEVNSQIGFCMFKVRLTPAIDWYNKFEQSAKRIVRKNHQTPKIMNKQYLTQTN